MSGQTVNRISGQGVALLNLQTLDSNGQACVGIAYSLVVLSGDPTGLTLSAPQGAQTHWVINCVKPGTYTIQLNATNTGGSISTDAAGDTAPANADTIVVTQPGPASQTWTYS